MKKLPDLVWTPAWTSDIGCIHGALTFLGIAPDISWLFGATGHAFILNMLKDGSCPSGPTAWETAHFYELGKNIGYEVDMVWGDKRKPDFQNKQKAAWDLARASLDANLPVVGWEMVVAEFYVVNGYDDQGYYFSGPGEDAAPSPKPWQELGESDIGMLELYSIKPVQAKDVETQILEGLTFALAFNQGSPEYVLPDYLSGEKAYQVWINAMESGQASLLGTAYNAAVWEECRRNGSSFLLKAKTQLKGQMDSLFDQAINAYREVASHLGEITELYPFFENNRQEPVGENPRSQKAAKHLQAAMAAEIEGQKYLGEIAANLS